MDSRTSVSSQDAANLVHETVPESEKGNTIDKTCALLAKTTLVDSNVTAGEANDEQTNENNDQSRDRDQCKLRGGDENEKVVDNSVEPQEGEKSESQGSTEKVEIVEAAPLALPLARRVGKRGRSLIPRQETKEAVPQNFVDVPDYGYVGMDGSFQSPF